MNPSQYPTSWTTDDFDALSWHDNTVHGIRFHNPDEGYDFDLIFDIDHILEWILLPGGVYEFIVAPARLTFSSVDKLHLDFHLTYKQDLTIDRIEREEISTEAERRGGLRNFKWTLALQSFSEDADQITFEARDFTQVLTGPPVRGGQSLSDDQR